MTDRKHLFEELHAKMEAAGFVYEKVQKAHRQKRKEKELVYEHEKLLEKLGANGFSGQAEKFYIKPISDEPNCPIGFVTGKTTPLLHAGGFCQPNAFDTYKNLPAWVNEEGDLALDRLLKAITEYVAK